MINKAVLPFFVLVIGLNHCAHSMECEQFLFSHSEIADPSMTDESGFINYLNLSEDKKEEQESIGFTPALPKKTINDKRQSSLENALPEVRQFLGSTMRDGFPDIEFWLNSYLNNQPGSEAALELIIRSGADHDGNATWFNELFLVVKRLNMLSESELMGLTISQQLQILSLFSKWRVLPSKRFQNLMQKAIGFNIEYWSEKNIKVFASARGYSPTEMTKKLNGKYFNILLNQFSSWSLNTQFEVLGAEFIHLPGPPILAFESMIKSVIKSLNKAAGQADLNHRQLYRRLLHMRAAEPTQLPSLLWQLEIALENGLKKRGLSLTDRYEVEKNAGYNQRRHFSFEEFENFIAQKFPSARRRIEYSDPSRPGFFDPIDSYWTSESESEIFPLVLESDGIHHYFLRMNENGDMISGKPGLVLNPKDQAKDRSLRRSGVNVLRLTRYDKYDLENLDLLELIRLQ